MFRSCPTPPSSSIFLCANTVTHHELVVVRGSGPTLTSQYLLMRADTLAAGVGDDPDAVPGPDERRGGRRNREQRHESDGDHRDDGGERDECPAGSRAGLRRRCAPRWGDRHCCSVFQPPATVSRTFGGGWQLKKKHPLSGFETGAGRDCDRDVCPVLAAVWAVRTRPRRQPEDPTVGRAAGAAGQPSAARASATRWQSKGAGWFRWWRCGWPGRGRWRRR